MTISWNNPAAIASEDDVETKRGFEEIMLPHLGAVHQLAAKLTADGSAAEDLVLKTYRKAYKAFPTLRDPERARSWLVDASFM